MPVKPGTIFNDIDAIKKAIRELPLLIGNDAENFFKENFDKQGFQGDAGLEPWEPRKGIERGKKRALLVLKGNLKRGVRKYVSGYYIKVGVTGIAKIYADIQNTGGDTHPTVTPKMRKWAWAMYAKTKQVKYKALALTKQSSLTIHIPKRKFIGNSKQLDKRINKIIEAKLKGLIK